MPNSDQKRPFRNFTLDERIYGHVQRLARRMLRKFSKVRRWDETDDITSIASLRVWKALQDVEVTTERHYHRIVAQNIRWVLLDLARKHNGPHGLGANHETWHGDHSQIASDPTSLARWSDFHLAVEELPSSTREVFDLLWYSGLSRGEVAELLEISPRTLMYRWRDARLKLGTMMDGQSPVPPPSLREGVLSVRQPRTSNQQDS